jgi:hypothetical protein
LIHQFDPSERSVTAENWYAMVSCGFDVTVLIACPLTVTTLTGFADESTFAITGRKVAPTAVGSVIVIAPLAALTLTA